MVVTEDSCTAPINPLLSIKATKVLTICLYPYLLAEEPVGMSSSLELHLVLLAETGVAGLPGSAQMSNHAEFWPATIGPARPTRKPQDV